MYPGRLPEAVRKKERAAKGVTVGFYDGACPLRLDCRRGRPRVCCFDVAAFPSEEEARGGGIA
jgi:hypothetical protein